MKLGAWMIMLVVMTLFLSFMGMNIPALNPIPQTFGINISETNATLISADIENSGVWCRLFCEEGSGGSTFTVVGIEFTAGILILLLGAGAIVIGLFAKGYDTSLVILPFVVFIGGIFISAFWGVISYVKVFNQFWMTGLVTLIFGGLAIGFIMALVDYYAGR